MVVGTGVAGPNVVDADVVDVGAPAPGGAVDDDAPGTEDDDAVVEAVVEGVVERIVELTLALCPVVDAGVDDGVVEVAAEAVEDDALVVVVAGPEVEGLTEVTVAPIGENPLPTVPAPTISVTASETRRPVFLKLIRCMFRGVRTALLRGFGKVSSGSERLRSQ